jgi:hypothetical protein
VEDTIATSPPAGGEDADAKYFSALYARVFSKLAADE